MKTRFEAPTGSPRAGARAVGRLEAGVVDDGAGFAALEGEWGALHASCPSATPFQSWEWLYSWWEHYGGPYGLRIVTVRDGGGDLVGLAPLMVERGRGFGRLLFIGHDLSDFLDVLAVGGREGDVARAVAGALRGMGGWQVADLQELRPGAVAYALEDGWTGPRVLLRQSTCPVTEVKPWEDLIAALTQKRRSIARQTLRRAEQDGVSPVLVGPEGAEEAARRLVALHRESWRGRGIGLEHKSRRFEAHLEAAVSRMTAAGLGAISEFRRDGEAVVSHFLVFGRDFVGGYMFGASEEALKRYQYSSLCMWDAANVARSKDLRYVNDLRGEESYKVRWSSELVPNHRLILGRSPVVVAAYGRWQVLRSKALAYAVSEEAPRWVKRSVVGYRDLRTRISRAVERISG